MFKELRDRVVNVMGIKKYALDNLDSIDLDSADSICISITDSDSSESSGSMRSTNLDMSQQEIEAMARRQVISTVRIIKNLEKLHLHRREPKLSMQAFMDMIRDQKYTHVSMNLIKQYIRQCRMVPKPIYLHYYTFFLYYGMYYHHVRSTLDIIDEAMVPFHRFQFISIKAQLKYLCTIIKESRVKNIKV